MSIKELIVALIIAAILIWVFFWPKGYSCEAYRKFKEDNGCSVINGQLICTIPNYRVVDFDEIHETIRRCE